MERETAYVIYRPGLKSEKEQIFYNQEAKSVFFPPIPEGEKISLPEISSLCAKWKKILDSLPKDKKEFLKEGKSGKDYIDILQSWRRKYVVRGIILGLDKASFKRKEEMTYLFIIERLNVKGLNLAQIFKQQNLNRREQEIVRLIIDDFGNKEIADRLGISINTVKAYMKILMRKVGVHTRAGLISALLTTSAESTSILEHESSDDYNRQSP